MTMTVERPTETSAASLTWNVPTAGVWVASAGDRFVGLVRAYWGTGFSATTALGRDLGMFSSLAEAQEAVELHT